MELKQYIEKYKKLIKQDIFLCYLDNDKCYPTIMFYITKSKNDEIILNLNLFNNLIFNDSTPEFWQKYEVQKNKFKAYNMKNFINKKRNDNAFYAYLESKNPDSNYNKLMSEDVLGKYVYYNNEIYGKLIAITSSDEDYYYVVTLKDLSMKFISAACSLRYVDINSCETFDDLINEHKDIFLNKLNENSDVILKDLWNGKTNLIKLIPISDEEREKLRLNYDYILP